MKGGERLHRRPSREVRLVEEVAVALAAQEVVLEFSLLVCAPEGSSQVCL